MVTGVENVHSKALHAKKKYAECATTDVRKVLMRAIYKRDELYKLEQHSIVVWSAKVLR